MDQYNFYEKRQKDKQFELSADLQLPPMERGEAYSPSSALIRAVNVALMLQKPLLLTGEPGTGKSELAFHIADHFGWGDVEFFATRTDSVASDLLYRYDALAHFQKVNLEKGNPCELTASDIENQFITYVALGRAICDSIGYNEKGVAIRRVVLIDEIDKAPRDLPNDILSIIENMTFDVPELKTVKNAHPTVFEKKGNEALKPVVILTSNSEKNLPEAFLRRCLFFNIDMPDEEQLMNILLLKKRILSNIDEKTGNDFVKLFFIIRELIKGKKPATHELILWVWWMQRHGFQPNDLYLFDNNSKNPDTEAINETLLSGISIVVKEADDWQVVVKAITTNALIVKS
jgi:MoxR-like ATPase